MIKSVIFFGGLERRYNKRFMNDRKNYKIKILILIIFILPILYGFSIVHIYGINVFFMDEWTFPIQMKNKEEVSLWKFFWDQHNEHRIFFPKVVSVLLGELSFWNTKVFMYFGWFMLSLFYLVVAAPFVKNLKDVKKTDIAAVAVIGLSVFNTCQIENYLWGFQIAWFMVIAFWAVSFSAFSVYYQNGKSRYMIGTIVSAVIASFSSMQGLVVWIAYICIYIMLIFSKERIDRKGFRAIIVSGIVTCFLYFYKLQIDLGQESLLVDGSDEALAYFIGIIGSTLLQKNSAMSYTIGFIVVLFSMALMVGVILKKRVLKYMKYIGPMFAGIGACILCALGRGGGGVISSRYTTNAVCFLTCFLILAYQYLKEIRYQTEEETVSSNIILHSCSHLLIYSLILACIVSPILLCTRNIGCLKDCSEEKKTRVKVQDVVANYKDVTDEDLKIVFPSDIRPFISYLQEHNLNVFADKHTRYYDEAFLPEDSQTVVGDFRNPIDKSDVIIGDMNFSIQAPWSFDYINNKSYKKVFMKINEKFYNTIPEERMEVADLYNNPELRYTGFSFSKNKEVLEEGINTLECWTLCQDDVCIKSAPVYLVKQGEEVTVFDSVGTEEPLSQGMVRMNSGNVVYCVETVNGVPVGDGIEVSVADKKLSISGWLIDQTNQTVPSEVYLEMAGRYYRLNQWERTDVSEAFGNENYKCSGIEGSLYLNDTEPELYGLSLVAISADKTYYYEICDFASVHLQ